MAARYYDEAILKKIKGWIKDPNMRVLGTRDTADLFKMRADMNGDKELTLPMVTIGRSDSINLLSTNKQPMTFDGYTLDATIELSKQLNAIPIQLHYDIDIFTKYDEEADEYVRNFIFNIINYPDLSINIPYNNLNLEYKGHLTLLSPVTDNSSVPLKLERNQFCRWTISVEINDAYLFSVPIVNNVLIDDDIEIIAGKENKKHGKDNN